MTVAELMKPFVTFMNCLRNMTFNVGEFTLSFWDVFVWCMFASIVINFIVKIRS